MSNIKIKLFIGSEIRRLSVSTKTNFDQFLKTVQTFYLIQKPDASPEILSQLKFKYQDIDEDWVSFSTNEEWKEAFSNFKEVLKIKIELNEPRKCHWKERCQKNQNETKPEEKKCHGFGNGFFKGCHGRRWNQQSQPQQEAFDFSQLGNFASFLNPGCLKQAQSFMTPENMELAKNLFQQFTGGEKPEGSQDSFDFSKIFSFVQPREEEEKQIVHHHIICDNCDQTPVGNRFKCNDCQDFDFCQKCFDSVNQHHFGGKHNFIKIEKPQGFFGRERGSHCPRKEEKVEKVESSAPVQEIEEIVMDEELLLEEESKVEKVQELLKEEVPQNVDNKLELLTQMGFGNQTVNEFLLKKHKGDIQRVVYELLSSQ
jgi:hypothetical protein